MKKPLIFACGFLCFAWGASASIVPNISGSPTWNGSSFTWTYTLSLDNLEDLNPTNPEFVVLYDFNGYIPGSAVFASSVSGLTGSISVANVGPVPQFQAPPDNPSIPNIDVTFSNSTTITGPVLLGTLTLDSSFGNITNDVTSSAATKSTLTLPSDKTTFYQGPAAVPEPGTALLFGAGFLGLMAFRKRIAT